jgi:hypothetical protein
MLSRITQVSYWRIFSQTPKYYNFLQSVLKQKLFTKVNENTKQQSLGLKILNLTIKGAGAQTFGNKRLIKISECFARANILKSI